MWQTCSHLIWVNPKVLIFGLGEAPRVLTNGPKAPAIVPSTLGFSRLDKRKKKTGENNERGKPRGGCVIPMCNGGSCFHRRPTSGPERD